MAAGHGVTACAGGIQAAFRASYGYAEDAADTLTLIGRSAMRAENRDINWNLAVFGSVLVAALALVIVEVGR